MTTVRTKNVEAGTIEYDDWEGVPLDKFRADLDAIAARIPAEHRESAMVALRYDGHNETASLEVYYTRPMTEDEIDPAGAANRRFLAERAKEKPVPYARYFEEPSP